jgi:hypothetical protein
MGELMRRRERTSTGEERLQRWSSGVDEYGMMMMMVVVNGAYKYEISQPHPDVLRQMLK